MVGDEGPTPPKTAKAKKSRNRKERHAKSKAIVESDSNDSASDKPTKSADGTKVKRSSKPNPQYSEKELKYIKSDSSLLMPESRQPEFDEHHRTKISGETDIQQSNVSSSPGAMVKIRLSQVLTQLSKHLELTKYLWTDQNSRVT